MLRLTRLDPRDDRGAVAVIVAIMMVVVLGMAALVVDIGATQAKRAELQEAVDSAALAIAQECSTTWATTVASCASSVRTSAYGIASDLVEVNVADASVALNAPTFTADSVEVTATTTQVGIFSRIFDIDSTGLRATATAEWTQPVIPLPLAFHECALPAASDTVRFLRTDILDLNLAPSECGLLPGVTDLLGASWAVGDNCSFDVDLLTYVGGVLSNLLPSECVSMVTTLVGKQVIVPVYGRVLVPIVVNGVLLGNGYEVKKYALVTVTGYDFQSVNVLGISLGGPKDMPTAPRCPTLLGIELPLCQGLQGKLTEYLTPEQAEQRLAGVRLTE